MGLPLRIMQTMAEARPTRKTGKPSTNPIKRMMNGRKARIEVVEYSRFSISAMMRARSSGVITTPRRRMSALQRMAETMKIVRQAIRPRTLKRPKLMPAVAIRATCVGCVKPASLRMWPA